MKNQTVISTHGVPEVFLNKFGHHITAVLSGFDRLRFRATLRLLFVPAKMAAYLCHCQVRIKDFKSFAEGITARIKAAAYASAQAAGRPALYLASPGISKEAKARQIARADGITEGLIALFSATEPCLSYSVRGDAQTKQTQLVLETRKMHPLLSLLPARRFGPGERAGANLVPLHRGRVFQWPRVVGPPDGSRRADL